MARLRCWRAHCHFIAPPFFPVFSGRSVAGRPTVTSSPPPAWPMLVHIIIFTSNFILSNHYSSCSCPFVAGPTGTFTTVIFSDAAVHSMWTAFGSPVTCTTRNFISSDYYSSCSCPFLAGFAGSPAPRQSPGPPPRPAQRRTPQPLHWFRRSR